MFSGDDVYRPSFFEMIAADRLLSSLKPSLQHITTVLARRHSSLEWLRRYNEEVFYALSFALESHYLNAYDGSFAENFYGLRRIRVNTNLPPALARLTAQPAQYSSLLFGAEAVQGAMKSQGSGGGDGSSSSASSSASSTPNPSAASSYDSGGFPPGHSSFFQPLSTADRRRALFFLVALPYLKSKLERLFLRWRDCIDEEGFEEIYDPQQHSAIYNLTRRTLVRVYPFFHALMEGSSFLNGLRFLFDRSVFYSPWLALSSQVCRRMNMDEMTAGPRVAPPVADALALPRQGLLGLVGRLLGATGTWFQRYAKYLVLLSIFSFKFLEWWHSPANAYYNGGNGAAGRGRKWPIPPPPIPPKPSAHGLPLPEEKDQCPLCEQERTNPAATPTGYVFCYSCIHAHLSVQPTCPVTLKPCTVEQLRKIYEN